uniref:NADH dehydrogenase subunit 2 n=1 Tax=Syngamus trachea TaxID=70241 RepID=D3J886_SYNTR|nr:NADH dehydrogenase subunit 2 [Syngamus trachea]ACX85185.1 NADH dehydrogenase subunit 2 [Syngamus trachea]
MLFLVMVYFVLFLSLLVILVDNILVWWGVFLLMTLVFVMLNKGMKSYSSVLNYFILQESAGLLFLVFSSGCFQLLILMLKIGVAPFHFWIFSVANGVFGFNLMWFLTFQKLPLLLVLLQLLMGSLFFLLFLGLFMCILQMFMLKSYKNLLIVSSTESTNWVIMGLLVSFFNIMFVFFYYVVIMLLVIPKFEFFNLSNFLSWETVLVFMNLPFSVSFFVKIFSLMEVLKVYGVGVLFLLFVMFLSVVSISFWLVNLSSKLFFLIKYNKVLFCLVLPLTLVVLL